MRRLLQSLIAGSVLAIGAIAMAGVAEPWIGTWSLNLAKSHFGNGPKPKSVTRAYALVGDSVELKLTGVGSDGLPLNQGSTFRFDGKDYPYTGRTEFDAVAARRIDASHYETTQKKSGQVVSTSVITISADGRTFTQVTKRLSVTGTPTVTAVYDRQ